MLAVADKEVGEEFDYIDGLERITVTPDLKIDTIVREVAEPIHPDGGLTEEDALKIMRDLFKRGPHMGIGKPDEVPEIESIHSVKISNEDPESA